MNTLAEIRKAKAEMTKVIQAKGKTLLQEAFDAFFKKHPEVKALGWAQYTPHFNDGDACVFGVHELAAVLDEATQEEIDGFRGYADDDDDGAWVSDWGVRNDAKKKKAFEAAATFFGEVSDNEIFEAAFGDHVQVIATPGKFAVEEYSHD